MNIIKILIVDDQTLMCDGLKTILDLEEDMEVVATAENGIKALHMIPDLQPDIVLMDIRMPEMDGVECTRLIKKDFPKTKVLMLTTFNDEEYIVKALSYGAGGYLLKDIQGDSLIQAVRQGASGSMVMPASVAEKFTYGLLKLTSETNKNTSACFKDFSEREKEISLLMVEGLSNRHIALRLNITEGTVKNYISSIYGKMGVSDRIKAVISLKKHYGEA